MLEIGKEVETPICNNQSALTLMYIMVQKCNKNKIKFLSTPFLMSKQSIKIMQKVLRTRTRTTSTAIGTEATLQILSDLQSCK